MTITGDARSNKPVVKDAASTADYRNGEITLTVKLSDEVELVLITDEGTAIKMREALRQSINTIAAGSGTARFNPIISE